MRVRTLRQLPRRARLDKHRRAAKWVQTRTADRVQQYAMTLAHHYAIALELAEMEAVLTAAGAAR